MNCIDMTLDHEAWYRPPLHLRVVKGHLSKVLQSVVLAVREGGRWVGVNVKLKEVPVAHVRPDNLYHMLW